MLYTGDRQPVTLGNHRSSSSNTPINSSQPHQQPQGYLHQSGTVLCHLDLRSLLQVGNTNIVGELRRISNVVAGEENIVAKLWDLDPNSWPADICPSFCDSEINSYCHLQNLCVSRFSDYQEEKCSPGLMPQVWLQPYEHSCFWNKV